MGSFTDADKFIFALDDGHLTPIHHRELGGKEGHLYSKRVSWADVTINNVPLDQTLRYEDEIASVDNSIDENDRGVIIVNERVNLQVTNYDDNHCVQEDKWMRRLKRVALNPISLPEAKKKKGGPTRFMVKPKTEASEQRGQCTSDMFHELVDNKSTGILSEFMYTIDAHSGYEVDISWDDGDDYGNNVQKEERYCPVYKKRTWCPPEHWITPEVQWVKIWTKIDELERGYKRDYVYVPDGEYCDDSYIITGPAIYFFEDYENYCYKFKLELLLYPISNILINIIFTGFI